MLDPGGFGGVTITKSISIISAGFEAGVLVSGTNGIIVNAGPNDTVLLEGLDIEGLGTGLNGVLIIGGGRTTIRRCSIRNFTQNGVNLAGEANARVIVADSLLLHNAGGLNVQGASGAFNFGALQNSLADNNTSFATQVTGPSTLQLSGSVLSGSPWSISNIGGGAVISYGTNIIRNAGAPTQTLVLQ